MKAISFISASVLAIWCLGTGSLTQAIASEPLGKPLMDFSDASVARQWLSVNDDVMGGISEGNFRITDDKTLVFSGNLSLENQGGFASIRTRPANLNLDGYDAIATRVKGDGRTYYLDLRTASRRNATSYRAPVKTRKGIWQEVRVPLKDFVYTSFGRRVGGEPLKANTIQSVGFTLSDKMAGPFRLEVGSVSAEKDGADPAAADAKPTAEKDIVDTAVAAGNFKTLVTAVQAAGLVEALKGKGPLTVFAPSDDAFAKLPQGRIEQLLKPESREELIAILSYHVIPGKILLGTQSVETLQGQSLTISTAEAFEVNGANVIASNIIAANGVIHVIDSVHLPPRAKSTPQQAARSVIELAISRGVPLFNAGQASACAAIYEVAVDSLLKSHTPTLGDQDRTILENALREIRSQDQNPSQQAWTLRHAMDRVYASLTTD